MKIFYEEVDGTVIMISGAPGLSKEEIEILVPGDLTGISVDDDSLPSEVYMIFLFDALKIDYETETLYFDIPTSREIAKEYFRNKRKPLFEENDIALRDAMLANNADDILKYTTERDRLRDLTALLDAETTVEGILELKERLFGEG